MAETDWHRDALIQTAIESYPLQPLPEDFTQCVMRRLPRRVPRFHLEFMDLALPAFIAGNISLMLALGLWLVLRAGPLWLAELQLKLALIQLRLTAGPGLALVTWGIVLGGVVLVSAAGLAAWLSAPSPRLAQRSQ